VSGLFPDGHVLVRGDCFESTIPVSPGMSGSPVLRYSGLGSPLEVVGILSSSVQREESAVLDRSIPGQSIAARLSPEVCAEGTASLRVRLTIKSGTFVERPTAS
jgi:hypothetical protein